MFRISCRHLSKGYSQDFAHLRICHNESLYLVSPLSEARVPQSLDVDILNLPLELLEAPGEVCAEAVLDVVADLEVGRSPLDVVFMGGVKIVDRVAYLEI